MSHEEKVFLTAEITAPIGDVFLAGASPKHPHYQAVFEDDGDTGYFYILDTRNEAQPILDTLHIYNVQNVVDREKPSLFQILWSSDGLKTALLINDYPHAVFDLASRRGYCRTNFPPPATEFTEHSHEWCDDCIDWLL